MLTLRSELAPQGIGATALCPGKAATRITGSLSHRPLRFGGPSDAKVRLPLCAESQDARSPAEVVRMVIATFRADRAVVVKHGRAKTLFERGYGDIAIAAFDEALAWEDASPAS